MKLTYRGVRYDYVPTLIPRFGPVFATGVYRGAPVAFHTVVDALKQPRLDLVWRGIAHRTGSTPAMLRPMSDTVSAASSTPELNLKTSEEAVSQKA